MTMGDRVAVLKDGILQQVGTPRDLYDRPNNVFVAGFIGSPAMNIGTFPVLDGAAAVGNARVSLPREAIGTLTEDDKGAITVGFRPEDLDVVPAGTPDAIPVYVNIVEELGSDAFVYGSLSDAFGNAQSVTSAAADSQVIVRIDPRNVPGKGETVNVRVRPNVLHLFHAGSGERI
jgi:multiple sugar transport system ATP-binding protein